MVSRKNIIAALITIIPLILWGFAQHTAPVVTNESLENNSTDRYLLVDVRESDDETGTLKSGIRLDIEDTVAVSSIARQYEKSPLLVICDGGLNSIIGANTLIESSADSVYYLEGGLQKNRNSKYISLLSDNPKPPINHTLTVPEQYATYIASFVIKPLYMVLSFILVVLLYRYKQSLHKPLMIGLFFFWLGENLCMVNYFFFNDESTMVEYLHSVGMMLCFAWFMSWAIDILKQKLITFNVSKRCSLVPLCSSCSYSKGKRCRVESLQQIISMACIIVALIPLTMSITHTSYTAIVFGEPYFYSHAALYQLHELRVLPIIAIVLFITSLLFSYIGQEKYRRLTDDLCAFGLGVIGFMIFRVALYGLFFSDISYFNFWEEGTELLFIIFIFIYMWIFHNGLYTVRKN